MLKKENIKKVIGHPISTFVILTVAVMMLSSLLSLLKATTSYSQVVGVKEFENVLVNVEGLFNFQGFKFLISNAAKNFVTFTPLNTLIIGLIGLSVAHASGFIDAFIKRYTSKIDKRLITFFIIFLAGISSIINDVGYVILIPLSALIFLANGRNPLLGIIASFCGVAFSYGATLFAGSTEVSLVPITEQSAKIIDSTYHVSLLSNFFAIVISTILLSIVGTYIVEKILVNRVGKYKTIKEKEDDCTKKIDIVNVEEEEQRLIEKELRERKGIKAAIITFFIFNLFIVYMLIPGLPLSGLLLDLNEKTYIKQLFGDNSYFQEGFTFLISMMFLVVGIAYGIAAKTIKGDKDLIEKSSVYLRDVGFLSALIFFASQFISVFRKTNIGTYIVSLIANFLKNISFSGVPLVLIVVLLIAISSIFITTQTAKWTILAPVVVPLLMQYNISPQFSQFIFRAGDSMTKGFTPLLAYFVIFLGYLNIYNKDEEPISIRRALYYIYPYCLIIGITWIFILLIMYIINFPIGPNVHPFL